MGNQLARITGEVLSVPPARRGTSKAGNPFTIESVNVLVADQNVTTCQLPRRDDTGTFGELSNRRDFAKGDRVDFLVEFGVYQQEPQARVLGEFPVVTESDLNYLTGELTDAK